MAFFIDEHVQKILDEGAIGMAETARLIGTFRGGRSTHPSTITRWCLHGVKLANGKFLKLEFIRVADRLMTSKPALLRFLAAQQDRFVEESAAQPRTPAQRKRAADAAEAELEAMGV